MEERVRAFVESYARANAGRKYKLNNSFKIKKMIKEVCTDLKTALISGGYLSLIDVYAGLVQVVTYKSTDENGNPLTKRMPVSYDTTLPADCPTSGKERALVPDSSKKGLVYFEDNGGFQSVREISGGRKMYRGNIILVCWMNKKRSVGETYSEVTKAAYDQITEKLKGVIPSSNFHNLRVNPFRLRQDPNIFSKYTYDETVLQYLRPPFEYLAIDLQVTFITTCATEVQLNPATC